MLGESVFFYQPLDTLPSPYAGQNGHMGNLPGTAFVKISPFLINERGGESRRAKSLRIPCEIFGEEARG